MLILKRIAQGFCLLILAIVIVSIIVSIGGCIHHQAKRVQTICTELESKGLIFEDYEKVISTYKVDIWSVTYIDSRYEKHKCVYIEKGDTYELRFKED